VEWAQGDHVSLARNPNYWQSGRPYLDGLTASIIKDAQAQLVQLESGTIDMVKSPPLRDLARLKADSNYVVFTNPTSGSFFNQGVNVLNSPLDNKLVRQGLNYALDRKRISETVLLGAEPKSLPWLPSSPAYEAAKQNFYTFDLDKARSLLSQAGVSNLTTAIIPLADYAELAEMAQIYQGDLAKIGVTLNIVQIDDATWFDQANNRKYQGFYSTSATYGQLEPVTLYTNSRVLDPTGNNSGFMNQQYSALVNQAGAEPDASKRKVIYSQLNDYFLDQSFLMPIADNPARAVTRATVHDIGYTFHLAFSYINTWIG
jgi:peptide/nickel transport system substrate-binding protein